jgi:transglutaminase-like putative cysteine protease
VSGRIIYTGGWSPPPGFENLIVGTTPEGETICSHAWAEVFLPENGWIPVEPQGRFGELPYRVYQQLEEKWTEALAAYETAYGSI